jgi:hypothetical protein
VKSFDIKELVIRVPQVLRVETEDGLLFGIGEKDVLLWTTTDPNVARMYLELPVQLALVSTELNAAFANMKSYIKELEACIATAGLGLSTGVTMH